MGACRIQYALLLSLLGFVPCSDTLTCNKGIMVKLGSNFSKAPIEWKTFGTIESAPNEICQETVLLIDVGEKSLILASKSHSNPGDIQSKNTQVFSSGPGLVAASYAHFCDTELCNNAESTSVLIDSLSVKAPFKLGTTKCPVCLQFQGPCSQHITFVFCPVDTHCYISDMTVEGGQLGKLYAQGHGFRDSGEGMGAAASWV
ncbi:CD177 antigen-like [Rattus rattus]|uniref:CD177 antigen-like n=1 Tax=Rattus rattus TaxID=10117 RepID=UPI0013F2FC37|nr:CD177 antigen-like [Rattus rattus]